MLNILRSYGFLTEDEGFYTHYIRAFYAGSPSAQLLTSPCQQTDPFMAYKVNIFVDNSSLSGPPVIIERIPTGFNMFARLNGERLWERMSATHTMIKAGSSAAVNAGYLILNIRDVLLNAGVWRPEKAYQSKRSG